MPQAKNDAVCRGCWSLGNNCERCSKCRETEAAYLRERLADACEKAGKFAHWAQSEIRRLEAELADQKGLVVSLQGLLEKAICRIAAQSELLSKRAEMTALKPLTLLNPDAEMIREHDALSKNNPDIVEQ